jgi:hypothetical protein
MKSVFPVLKELENQTLEEHSNQEQTAERGDQSLVVQGYLKRCVEEEDRPLYGSRVEEVCRRG